MDPEEILKLLTSDLVVKWLENKESEEVQKFLKQHASPEITQEQFTAFLETEKGAEMVSPLIDKRVTEAVKKRDKYHEENREKEIKSRVAAEILKLNPQEEPWQKEIRELKAENEKERKARAQDQLKREIVEEAAKMGVDPFFIDDYLPNTIDEAKLYLKRIKDFSNTIVEKTTNELLAKGYKPGSGNGEGDQRRKSLQDLSKLSQEEMIHLEMEGSLDSSLSR